MKGSLQIKTNIKRDIEPLDKSHHHANGPHIEKAIHGDKLAIRSIGTEEEKYGVSKKYINWIEV